MTENSKNIVIESLNNGLLDAIKNHIAGMFGVFTTFEVKQGKGYYGYYVSLVETSSESARQLTATPLLAAMFKQANLQIELGKRDNENEVYVRVNISYSHPSGGSNGLELGTFTINIADYSIGEW